MGENIRLSIAYQQTCVTAQVPPNRELISLLESVPDGKHLVLDLSHKNLVCALYTFIWLLAHVHAKDSLDIAPLAESIASVAKPVSLDLSFNKIDDKGVQVSFLSSLKKVQ